MSYKTKILEILTKNKDQEMTIDEIISEMTIYSKYAISPMSKSTYVIDALKKLIQEDKVEMIITPDNKRKYLGNKYKLIL